MNDELINPGRAKALAIYAAIGLALGTLFVLSPPAGVIAATTLTAAHWFIGQIIQKRNGGRLDPFDGPAELTHRARLEIDGLAQSDPAYYEAAKHLELAEDALRRASAPLPPPT